MPGIDLNDTAAIQELEDRDYMRRLMKLSPKRLSDT